MSRKFLKDYFTFTRSERNGLLVLIIIIFILIIVRLIIPHIRQNKTYDFSEFQEEISEFEKSIAESDDITEKTKATGESSTLFTFDPNTASGEDLLKLGLEPKVAENIVKYRDKGGIFRNREDLKKIYGLDSADYSRVEPFIQIRMEDDTERQISGIRADIFQPLPLNTSDSAALVTIYGIGPVLSVRIIKYRNLLGGYINKEQLLEVYGMTHENFKNIRDAIYIDTAAVITININTADFTELSRHPYMSDYQARAIIAFRDIKGPFSDTDELTDNHLLPEEIFRRLKPYLAVE